MEEIVYLSIRLGCTAYLLYKVWEQKKRIGKICDLLYTPRKKPEMEKGHHRNPENAADVMGATRFVYLDENEMCIRDRHKPHAIASVFLNLSDSCSRRLATYV